MRTFEKSKKLDNVCYDVRGPVVDEADRMIEQGISIMKLNIGNLAPFGFEAPTEIIHAAQQIIQTALGGRQSADTLLLPSGRIYEQREYITERLNNIPGISAVKPKAAFYIFPKIDTKRNKILDDEKLVLDFLKEQHVLMVHGRGFNLKEPDHFRIVYIPRIEELKGAMDKLELFLSGYKGTR